MKKITLYKWTNFNATPGQSVGFSLDGIMSFDFVGEVEESEYILPEGFEVAESNAGTLEIYDQSGNACTLSNHKGVPFIATNTGKSIALGK